MIKTESPIDTPGVLPVSITYTKPSYYAPEEHTYARGMFVTINNHKQGNDSIYQSLKKQYQSILYGLNGINFSRDTFRVCVGKLPSRKKIMDDVVVKKRILMVAGIHNYDAYNNKTLRGSRSNIDYQHLHMYLYGVHHYLPEDGNALADKVEYLKKLIARHNRLNTNNPSKHITITPVGRGEYISNDVISPTSLYDYLQHPYKQPNKVCCINYIADTIQYHNNNYPLSYIYRR